MWFKEKLPEIYKKAYKFSGLQEIVHLKLGVKPAIDYSLAGHTGLLNIHTKDWAYELFDKCGIDHDKFFPLARSNSVLGEIDRIHREKLGLNSGVAVVAGGFDQCCAGLGAGVINPGIVSLSVGTLEAASVALKQCSLIDPLMEGNYGLSFHVVDGLYFSFAYIVTSGAILRWYRDTLGLPEVQYAKKRNLDPYDVIINSTSDRPSKVYIMPYFAGTGTPWLDPKQKGTIFGLSLDTDRKEIVKGILDGICYEIRLNLEILNRAGIRIDRLRAVGGGVKSSRWMQLKADIIGVPVETAMVNEAGCLGASFLAGQGIHRPL